MQSNALFDVLKKDIRTSTNDKNQELVNSIKLHLHRLLNSRSGSLTHLKEYGLPDIVSLYQGLPNTKKVFMDSIKNTVSRFEKRLKNVEVKEKTSRKGSCVLKLQILGIINNSESIQFDTVFLSGGGMKVDC